MAYFNHFPKIEFLNQKIVNLAIGVKMTALIKDDAFALQNYTVERNERPDHVAYNYYNGSEFTLVVLLSNKMLDPYFEWPLDTREFDE